MGMNHKYSIGERVYHRIGNDVSNGKVVGYEDGCYVIETLVDDICGYMHLTDEDVSKNYNDLKG